MTRRGDICWPAPLLLRSLASPEERGSVALSATEMGEWDSTYSIRRPAAPLRGREGFSDLLGRQSLTEPPVEDSKPVVANDALVALEMWRRMFGLH